MDTSGLRDWHEIKIICTDGSILVCSDITIFKTSECLKLCNDDREMVIPVSLSRFKLYFRFHVWYPRSVNCEPSSSLSLERQRNKRIMNYREDCGMCLDVYDTALRLCDSETMDSCLLKLSKSTACTLKTLKSLYPRTTGKYHGVCETLECDLINNHLIQICDNKFNGNLMMTRDVLTHLDPLTYADGKIHVLSRVARKLLEDTPENTSTDTPGKEIVQCIDSFMFDCITNFSKTRKLTDIGLLALKYCDGDENMTRDDIALFIESLFDDDDYCVTMSGMIEISKGIWDLRGENLEGLDLRFERMVRIYCADYLYLSSNPKTHTTSKFSLTSERIDSIADTVSHWYGVMKTDKALEVLGTFVYCVDSLFSHPDLKFSDQYNNNRLRNDHRAMFNLMWNMKEYVLSENRKTLMSMDLEDIATKYYSSDTLQEFAARYAF